MTILLVTPAPRGSRSGNRVTALRWTAILRSLGHRVVVAEHVPQGREFDVLIALHARRSAEAVELFARERPDAARIVALTGTDIYGDDASAQPMRATLELAHRLVALQPLAANVLAPSLVARTRTILQSAPSPRASGERRTRDEFLVCVVGHLRPVKDPLRTAQAARLLPESSRLRVVHLGAALSPEMAEAARAEQRENPRYHWLGLQPRAKVLATVAKSDLLVLSSRAEGGANAISEAIAAGVPVLSSRIDGSVGLVGADYPGLFPAGDTAALAALLDRSERDADFLSLLRKRCAQVLPLLDPARERAAWATLLAELFPR